MAKAGVNMDAVAAMCHAELSAWLDNVLASLGVKVPKDEQVIVSRRLPKPQNQN